MAESPKESLVSNGDFSREAGSGGWPADWGRGDPGTSWETGEGNPFVRFQLPEPGKMVKLFREMPLPAGAKGIDVTIRYRTKGVQPGDKPWQDARTIFHFLNANRKAIPPETAMVFANDTSDWKNARKAERAAILEKDFAKPPITPELKVVGNQVMTIDGKPVWLQGLAVDSMQWSQGENTLWSIRVALDDWKANVIRLPLLDTFWYGKGKGQPEGGEVEYRDTVDKAIKLAASRGAWIVLDLHGFGAPTDAHVTFWKEVGERYKNNPAVLYELFNEAHSLTWEVWRNGGSLEDLKHHDVNPTENTIKTEAKTTPGMQALVKAVRDTGAKNIIVAGGLDWAYDLWGIVNGYALDDLGGNGIIYVSHIYPWKNDWQGKVLIAADKHPIIITEIGCPEKWEDFSFIPPAQRYPLEGWSEDVLGMIQKNKLHWTGFSFHPVCGPPVIKDWEYTPTPFWGVYVKEALQGKQFEMKKMR